ncbi:hypothetical protein C0J52_12237 [Blattella germanica]|nr:hypothetical protein C0J52_12237 [Blattella germanica]
MMYNILRYLSNYKMRILLLLLLVLAIVFLTSGGNTSTNNVEDFNILLYKAFDSLSKLLDYMATPRSVVGDLIFGIVLSAEKNNQNSELVTEYEKKCRDVYTKFMDLRQQNNRSDYDIIMAHIVKQDLWEVDYPITGGKLRKPSNGWKHYQKSSHLSQLNKSDLLMMGTPKELESDECIAELVNTTVCNMSEKCKDIMTNNEEVHGYPLTHRLLYFQLGCSENSKFVDVEKQIIGLCSAILKENMNIAKMGIPAAFRDLFLEQISLCGMEGFAEFLNPYYIDWVIHLQTPDGCFTQRNEIMTTTGEELEHSHRVKREDGELGDDCTMHITGMAAIFLSVNIRGILEYWKHSLEI